MEVVELKILRYRPATSMKESNGKKILKLNAKIPVHIDQWKT